MLMPVSFFPVIKRTTYALLCLWAVMPLSAPSTVHAQNTEELFHSSGQPIPRFVSLRAGEVNVRVGPGTRYPIRYVYQKKRLPVEVVEEFSHWRKVRDHEGESGWIHKGLLSSARYGLTTQDPSIIYRKPDSSAAAVISAGENVLLSLTECIKEWCRIEHENRKGWIAKSQIWGVQAEETFD